MSRSTAQRLTTWQRLLRIKTAERDQSAANISQLQSKLRVLRQQMANLEQNASRTNASSQAAAQNNDFVLLSAISAQLQANSQTLLKLTHEIVNAESTIQQAITEQGRVQRLLTVLEKRIDDCTVAATHSHTTQPGCS